MHITRKIVIFLLSLIILFASCSQQEADPKTSNLGVEHNYLEIADTIITDVVILNPDGNEWTDFTLRNLNKKSLVDELFKSVYEGKLKPYDFFNNNTLSIEDIKALEVDPDFSRDNIAKVQFEEAWYYDPEKQEMVKKVHSIMLAYEIYNSLGEIRGYKPAFKVYFNNEETGGIE